MQSVKNRHHLLADMGMDASGDCQKELKFPGPHLLLPEKKGGATGPGILLNKYVRTPVKVVVEPAAREEREGPAFCGQGTHGGVTFPVTHCTGPSSPAVAVRGRWRWLAGRGVFYGSRLRRVLGSSLHMHAPPMGFSVSSSVVTTAFSHFQNHGKERITISSWSQGQANDCSVFFFSF
jgi:hypothetical protein